MQRSVVRHDEPAAGEEPDERDYPGHECVFREAVPLRVTRHPPRDHDQPDSAGHEEHEPGHDVAAWVVGDACGVLPQREHGGKEQADCADRQQGGTGYAGLRWPQPAVEPAAKAIVSRPKTTKSTCWTHPFGPASSALTGSVTGSSSSPRNAS